MITQLNLRCCQDEPVSMMKHLKMLMPEASQHQSLTRSMPNHQFHPTFSQAWKETACQIDCNHCCLLEVKRAQAPHPSGCPTPLQTCSSPLLPSLQSLFQHLLEMPHPWTSTQTADVLKLGHATTVISRDTLFLIALNLARNVFVPT